jgi:beta-lactamase class A
MLTRRTFLSRSLIVMSGWPELRRQPRPEPIASRLAALETKYRGRLGVATYDSSGRIIGHRVNERFPMCSTFKLPLTALILSRVDRGEEQLDRRITYSTADMVAYSPVTEKQVAKGMTIRELCHSTMTLSDNTAANLLLKASGGPAGLTAYLRSIGDSVTRLDRIEPALNDVAPEDVRDTTSPAAMTETTRRLILQNTLSPASRKLLTDWFVANRTGDARLRAGFPKGWRVGDKTGTGNRGATNDVAVGWPATGSPIVVAAYYIGSDAPTARRESVLAEVGRILTTD